MAHRVNYDGDDEWADISDQLRNRVVNHAMTNDLTFKEALVEVLGDSASIENVEAK